MFTLKELRQLVRLQLLEEAGAIDLANRQIGRLAIVFRKQDKKQFLIAVSATEEENHQGTAIPKVFGVAIATHEFDGYHRLTRLYADNAAASITLLASALEHWQRVIPDFSVSPAAMQVMKRYYEQHKDNPALIT